MRSMTPSDSSLENMEASADTSDEDAIRAACPKCHGAGYLYPRREDGSVDYSAAKPCDCTIAINRAHRQQYIQKLSNIGMLIDVTFASLDPNGTSLKKQNQEKYNASFIKCREYAEDPKGWLYIYGGPGTGKTQLAAAIGNRRYTLNQYFYYDSASDLLDKIKSSTQFDSENSYDDVLDGIRNTPLLIIDDFGLQADNQWSREKLDQIFSYRLNNHLPMVITSSTHPNDLDERWKARFQNEANCIVVELNAAANDEQYAWPSDYQLQKSMTFESFDYKLPNLPKDIQENLERAYQTALDYARNPEGWLVFIGEIGCGKTHLAASIVNYQYEHNKPAIFVDVSELLNKLKSSFNRNSDTSYNDVIERVKKAPLLVLDDFGAVNSSAWNQDELYRIINTRYNSKLPTVITSSVSLNDMDRRISSRLADPKVGIVFTILASDYRFPEQEIPEKKQTFRRN